MDYLGDFHPGDSLKDRFVFITAVADAEKVKKDFPDMESQYFGNYVMMIYCSYKVDPGNNPMFEKGHGVIWIYPKENSPLYGQNMYIPAREAFNIIMKYGKNLNPVGVLI